MLGLHAVIADINTPKQVCYVLFVFIKMEDY